MFKIELFLEHTPTLYGCAALDFLRKWQLPIGEMAYFADHPCLPEKFTVEWDVDEGFARTHFMPDSISEDERIPLAWMAPGEIIPGPQGGVVLNPNLTPERARELFVAARHRRILAAEKTNPPKA